VARSATVDRESRCTVAQALAGARAEHDRIAALLLSESEREPGAWELHGALLTHIERLTSELEEERRSQRLNAENVRAKEGWQAWPGQAAGTVLRRLRPSVRTMNDVVRQRLRHRPDTPAG
jgi:hypothetical protein